MKNYLEYIQKSIVSNWDFPALTDIDGETFSYSAIAKEIAVLSEAFSKTGLSKGDKVALCARNSSRWGIAFLATQVYGAVAVPILSDFTPESVTNLVNHSESKVLFTDGDMWKKLSPDRLESVNLVLRCDDFTTLYDKSAMGIDIAKMQLGRYISAQELDYPKDSLDELAVINYTSGTTSAPKGVMLINRNISSNMDFALTAVQAAPHQGIVSMLPLAHMYGLMWEFLFQLVEGQHVFFLRKTPAPKVLFKAFALAKPYMVITVPLVIEKIFRGAVIPALNKKSAKLMLKIPGVSGLILGKVRNRLMKLFGGNLQYMFIGGAAINAEVEKWMKKVRLPYSVGYGMTECAPLLCYSDWRTYIAGSCGRCVTHMEVRIDSPDPLNIPGEILAKGDNVTVGYYKNPEETAKVFTEDGWMKTGDIGLFDKGGNLYIKGRCKNMILTANGQNIYPEEIEDRLNNCPYVAESLVVERERKLTALIYPDYAKAGQDGIDPMTIMKDNMTRVNSLLPAYSRLSSIELMENEFEKTPKRSIKRFLYK